ncbi:hypothetical protein JOQ06_021687 [Pogonophryne albipinna]|uniref:Hexosyltransferase n=1 Tax=Pogonophryne albipinna TaxID=1090488 RepID=A0AAD6AE11_9TELE|nr:hypothetical protein JOQ06_021687 [Pogonophryne albipinna]
MFMNFRRIHKCQVVQLLTACMMLCVVMVSWEELDHHVVSHMRSYTYRYLVNSYDFLNSNFNLTSNRHRKDGSTNVLLTYPYLINHPGKCARGDGKSGDDVLLLLFVKSSPENFERRQAIRDTWGNERFVWSKLGATVRMVFALGVDAKQRSRVQRALLQEDQTFRDLIQQDFLDTFHNLTAKLITQFHWVHDYCPQARFLMSADDDIFVHMPNLVKYLRQLLRNKSGVKDFWVGHVHRGSPPVRRKESKYHIPYDLYPWPSYPDYTAGAGYVVSGDVAAKIYQATQEHVYFSGEGKALYHPCIYDHMITSHGHATDVRSLWQAATDPAVYGKSRGFMGNLYCTTVRAMMLCRPYYQNSYSCMAAFT